MTTHGDEKVTPTCGRCGQPARGFAEINGVRYCHGDADPTCYQRAQWEMSGLHTLDSVVLDLGLDDLCPRCGATDGVCWCRITDLCHCGEPVVGGFDGDPMHHRGMCADCDAARCDAYPLDCPQRLQPPADRPHETPRRSALGDTEGDRDDQPTRIHPGDAGQASEGPDRSGVRPGSGVPDRAGSDPTRRRTRRSARFVATVHRSTRSKVSLHWGPISGCPACGPRFRAGASGGGEP